MEPRLPPSPSSALFPTRLGHWDPHLTARRDSPGKNTGVGCHFLLQCVKVKSESEVAQLCPSLRDPMDCSPPGSSVHGIFQARVLEWGAKIGDSVSLHLSKPVMVLMMEAGALDQP